MSQDLNTVNNGLLEGAHYIPSPNFDDRPKESAIDLIVIHSISLPPCEYGSDWITHLFTNHLDPDAHPYFKTIYQLEVSSHLLIRRQGEVIQYVPFDKRAWHAGQSEYQGRTRCNDFSIGIELEGCDDDAYEAVQYTQLARSIKTLCAHYPQLSAQHITGHCDIAPHRKTDPGPLFDWDQLNLLLQA